MIGVVVQQADLLLIPAAAFFVASCRSAFKHAPTKSGALTWCIGLTVVCAWLIHSELAQ